MITVICEGSAHEGKRAVVARFGLSRVLDDVTGEWGPAEWRKKGYRHRESPPPSRRAEANARTRRIGPDRRPVTLRSPGPVDHEKIALACPLCGIDVQARKDRLDAVLDRLADAGVSEVSLPALGARIQGSAPKRP